MYCWCMGGKNWRFDALDYIGAGSYVGRTDMYGSVAVAHVYGKYTFVPSHRLGVGF